MASSYVSSSTKKRTRTINTKSNENLTSVESDILLSAGPSCNVHLPSGEQSVVKSPSSTSSFEESDEARKKFPNAKSISSAQFFGRDDDHVESTATLTDIVKDKLWWFGNKLGDLLEIHEHDSVDVSRLRSEVAMLTLKCRSISDDADSRPFIEMAMDLCDRIRIAINRHRDPNNTLPLLGAHSDVIYLYEELMLGKALWSSSSKYKPCLVDVDKY